MQRTTIRDVARAAGVSINTVSRALNGKPDINPETKRLILEAADSGCGLRRYPFFFVSGSSIDNCKDSKKANGRESYFSTRKENRWTEVR